MLLAFWNDEEPRNWTAINYLTKLLEANPSMDKRNGNGSLGKYIKLVSEHIVPGSFADTAINLLAKSKEVPIQRLCLFH